MDDDDDDEDDGSRGFSLNSSQMYFVFVNLSDQIRSARFFSVFWG